MNVCVFDCMWLCDFKIFCTYMSDLVYVSALLISCDIRFYYWQAL